MRYGGTWQKLVLCGLLCLLASCRGEGPPAPPAQSKVVDIPFVPPKLTVKGWYFEKDGKPIYLGGCSLGAALKEANHPDRVRAVEGKANYIRTWLELWKKPEFACPFKLKDGKADLSQYDPDFFQKLKDMLDLSARMGIVQELTLFNPWGARYDWDNHWWNPRNNFQGHRVTKQSLYTLGNPCQSLQERWVDKVLETVNASLARDFVIIEIDNELGTGGGAWRKHFVAYVRSKGKYIVSTIVDYCSDYDVVKEGNHIISRHKGGSGDPPRYHRKIVKFNKVKPVIFNELYVWWHHPREAQRSVFWTIFMAQGMFCVDHWGGGKTTEEDTLSDVGALVRFANSVPFHLFTADDSWIVSCPGQKWSLSRPGSEAAYLAYIWGRENRQFNVNLPKGSYNVRWLDPATGKTIRENTQVLITGEKVLDVPTYHYDVIVYIAGEK